MARIGPVISPIALMVADRASSPSAMWRSMFSSTTMASSTTMPMASTSPNSVRLFRLKPISAMTAKVPTSDTGTSIMGRIIAFQSCRNKQHHDRHQDDGVAQGVEHLLDRLRR